MASPMTSQEYVADGGNTCPRCGSKDIQAEWSFGAEHGTAWNVVECEGCEAKWHDIYQLTGWAQIPDEED